MRILAAIAAVFFALAGHAASTATITNLTVTRLLSAAGAAAATSSLPRDHFPIGGTNLLAVEFLTVSSASNAPIAAYTFTSPYGTNVLPVASVPYEFRMMKYKFDNGQVQAMYDANPGLSFLRQPCDVNNWGTNKTWLYHNHVTRMRFVNWMNTIHGYQPAYKFDAQGYWQLWDVEDSLVHCGRTNRYRHKNAYYWIASIEEFNKAMFWDFTNNRWWDYQFGSDSQPTYVTTPGTLPGTVVGWYAATNGPAPVLLSGGLSLNGFTSLGNGWDPLETPGHGYHDPVVNNDQWIIVKNTRWDYALHGRMTHDYERPYGSTNAFSTPYGEVYVNFPTHPNGGLRVCAKPLPRDTWAEGTTNQFTIEFVTIDDTNNPAKEIHTGVFRGAVPYVYRISKYAQTEDQVAKAQRHGGLNINLSALGTNMPATMIDQSEAFRFANYLNSQKGYQQAYYFSNSIPVVWPDSADWDGGTNKWRHKNAIYHLPSVDEYHKAAKWDKVNQKWWLYGQGSSNSPTAVNGYFARGSTTAGTAIHSQAFDDRFPEWDTTNTISVTLTTSGGAVTAITYDFFVGGHNIYQPTNAFRIVQGGITNATATAATWLGITNVPGTLTNFVAGAGYTDGLGTITLGGNTVGVVIFTDGAGGVVGARPYSGKFATNDYATVLTITQAGGSNATCRVMRYVEDTYTGGVKVPATFTIVSGGSGYVNGAATVQPRHWGGHTWNDWIEFDPVFGEQYYKLCIGAAEVTRAGGLSPFGVMGLAGNTSTMTDTEDDFVNDGSSTWMRYYGLWWERALAPPSDTGSEYWNIASPTTGAYANGFRVCSKPLP